MTPYKLGWKVVYKTTYGRNRFMSSSVMTRGEVEYRFSKPTRPNKGCGPLCVFDNLEDARCFAKNFGTHLFPCAYIPSKKGHVWSNADDKIRIQSLPKGKALASEVILLKERKVKK